jgi:hypothetical protein
MIAILRAIAGRGVGSTSNSEPPLGQKLRGSVKKYYYNILMSQGAQQAHLHVCGREVSSLTRIHELNNLMTKEIAHLTCLWDNFKRSLFTFDSQP